MSKIDLNTFKSRLPHVKSMIQKTLKVDVGTQNAYDIMAVSNGYPHYHAVKAISRVPYYELKANLGPRDNPLRVTLDVGHWVQLGDAQATALELLTNCQQFQTWFLYKDGENTHIKFETQPKPKKGLAYQIEVTGDTMSDVEIALEEVTRRLDNVSGFDKNDSGSFSFQRAGEEHDPDTMFDENAWDYAIFDENQLLFGCNDSPDEALKTYHEDEEELRPWSGFLVVGQQITPDQLREFADDPAKDNETYFAEGIDDFGQPYRAEGRASELLETLDDAQPSLVHLYWEMLRKS